MHHLDVVVSDQSGGPGGGERGVVNMASHAGVHHFSWANKDQIRVLKGLKRF